MDSSATAQAFDRAEPRPGCTSSRRPLVHPSQRKRVRAACVRCRKNKSKCDGQYPCSRCKRSKSSCDFESSTEPLTLRAETQSPKATIDPKTSRERMLEALLIENHIEIPSHLTVSTQASSEPATNSSEVATGSCALISEARKDNSTTKNRSSKLTEPRDSGEVGEDSASIVLEHVPASHTYVHDEGRTFFNGGFSTYTFFDSVHDTVPGQTPDHTTSPNRKTLYKHYMVDSPEVLFSDLRPSLLAALPPRHVLDFLSGTFFRYSQSNFFFVHPAIFKRKLEAFLAGTYEFDVSTSEVTRRPVEFVCVLFMVLALGSQFAELEHGKELGSDPIQGVSGSLGTTSTITSMNPLKVKLPTPAHNPGWRFYQASRRLLADVISSSSMTSIQACALQGTFLITTSAHDAAYIAWGLAVRMSVNMGLHQAMGDEFLHPYIRELRNRLWWSVYCLDRLFGFWMGRPIMLPDSEIHTPFPEEIAELKEEQPTGSVEGQHALIKLCRIMGSIVSDIYPSRSVPGKKLVMNMDATVRFMKKLRGWKAELPESLQFKPNSTRGTVHLHLCQQHAIILLTRTALIHSVVTHGVDTSSQQPIEKIEFLKNAGQDCIQAAISTIELLADLRRRGMICNHSCQDPLFCTAALCVLLLAVKIEPPGPQMKDTILRGVSALLQLGEGSETAASALSDIMKGFEPFFQDSADPEPHDTRSSARRAWETWRGQSPNTAGSLLTSQQTQDVDEGATGQFEPTNHEGRPTPIDEYDVSPSERKISGNSSRDDLADFQNLAFDPLMDTWTIDRSLWFGNLDESTQDFEFIYDHL